MKRMLLNMLLLGVLVLPLTGCVIENNLRTLAQEIAEGIKIDRDPLELLNKHGFKSADHLGIFVKDLPKYDFSTKRVLPNWKYAANLDETIYQKINALYADIKDVNIEKDFLMRNSYQQNAVSELIEFKQKAPNWLVAREKALAIGLVAREKALAIGRDNPLLIVSEQYKDAVKPESFDQIMKAVSLLPDWKIDAVLYPGDLSVDYSTNYNFFDFADSTPNSTLKIMSDTYRVFNNPPLAVNPSNEKPILIFGTITKKIGSRYVLSSPKLEAIADIPKSIISGSGIGFKDLCYIVCKLTDIEEVNTLLGTKTVSIVKVMGLFPFREYEQFIEYILGHPRQFPPEKYVTLN